MKENGRKEGEKSELKGRRERQRRRERAQKVAKREGRGAARGREGRREKEGKRRARGEGGATRRQSRQAFRAFFSFVLGTRRLLAYSALFRFVFDVSFPSPTFFPFLSSSSVSIIKIIIIIIIIIRSLSFFLLP